jgi:hypothetical protein
MKNLFGAKIPSPPDEGGMMNGLTTESSAVLEGQTATSIIECKAVPRIR